MYRIKSHHLLSYSRQFKMSCCIECGNVYTWPDSLKRHLKVKHSKYGKGAGERMYSDDSQQVEDSIQLFDGRKSNFLHPFTMTVSGPTGSGKTHFVKSLLEKDKITPAPDRMLYLYKRWQPLYDKLKETVPGLEFVQGVPESLDKDSYFDPKKNNVIILDDMMSTAAKDQKIADLFTEGSHHRNLSVLNLTQNLFPQGKNAVTQRRNTHYMVVFKSPMGQDHVRTLGCFTFPGKVKDFINIYHKATNKPHGYLVLDSKQSTPDNERLKINMFGEGEPPILNIRPPVNPSLETPPRKKSKLEHDDNKDLLKPPIRPPLPGIPVGAGDADSNLEKHEALEYHRPYLQWMMNTNTSKPPAMWDSYLSNMVNNDLSGVNNPEALVHLCVFHAKENDSSFCIYCSGCDKTNSRPYWFSRCPKCSKVHMYPKINLEKQELNCESCNCSFPTDNDLCEHCAVFCPHCNDGLVRSPSLFEKKPKRGYPNVEVLLKSI